MKTGLSASFCLIVYFLVCSSEAQKNITHENVTAEVGQDVILPCKVPNNINITAVEWNRPHQEPEYVLFYRDGHLVPHNQHESYKDRVDLKDKEMKDGDVSMILKNVMMDDTGRYECRVFEEGKVDPISIINLEVYLSAQTNMEAVLGQEVILPCKVPNNININIRAVKWIRPDQDPEYVLFYRDGRLDPYNQHESYKDRVDLQDKDMKDGDVSMILKNVMKNDTGRYECQVFPKGTNRRKRSNLGNDPINTINLVVHLSEGDKGGGNKTGIIVGPVMGVILLLAVLALIGFLIYRQDMKKNRHLPVPHVEQPPIEMSTVSASPVEPPTASEALMEAPAEEQQG